MSIRISELSFSLPEKPFERELKQIRKLKGELHEMAGKAGTENSAFKRAYSGLVNSVLLGMDLADAIEKPIRIRALAVALNSDVGSRLTLTKRVFQKIDRLRPNPSTLFIQSLFQHYLTYYDHQPEHLTTARWLLNALEKKGTLEKWHPRILSPGGPKWLATEAIRQKRDFWNLVEEIGLHHYASGRFMKEAQGIYYVEQLEKIPVNQPHELFQEIKQKKVFNARYDAHFLVGHKVLEVLIRRAPERNVHDSWLKVVMKIAGDPRVPESHSRYQKWWSQLDRKLQHRVRGWLSKLDLRLFLEALENFSNRSSNAELKRMFPSRKKFLEGLEDRKLVVNTRLFLSQGAITYLKSHYDSDHLPAFSEMADGDKSIIHLQLAEDKGHLIEGSHSCYLWVYPKLHDSAVVFDYSKTMFSYYALTSGLDERMRKRHCGAKANIQHNPASFSWQKKAILELQDLGVEIHAKDVLSDGDYREFKRKHGVM